MNAPPSAPLSAFLKLAADSLQEGAFVKLTLSDYRGAVPQLQNVHVRPVMLRNRPHLAFVYRHSTRDITKNYGHEEGLKELAGMLGTEFRHAHLYTTAQTAELRFRAGGEPRLTTGKAAHSAPASGTHDRAKQREIPSSTPGWLRELGVTTAEGKVAKGMEAKFRQINKFVELLRHQLAVPAAPPKPALRLVDMGCGKGYLTFAAHEFLTRHGWPEAQVTGVEARDELVRLGNNIAAQHKLAGLRFEQGTIAETALEKVDILVALHACDIATDDALAKGIEAGASLILAAPCCHKELRPRLRPPPMLADALRHGIMRERQAEFVTDALRAALLEWAGYDTRIFEFISPEHTGKNLMIAAVKRCQAADREPLAQNVRELAAFYGISSQHLAGRLGFALHSSGTNPAA